MRTYILKRLLLVPPTLFGITLITFLIIQLAPGDPANMKVSPGVGGQQSANTAVSRDIYEKTLEQFDLDKPKLMQYVRWVGRLFGVDVQVAGAKQWYDAEVTDLLVSKYAAENPGAIEAQREQIEARVRADWKGAPEAIPAEVERQLTDWKSGQAEKRRYKYAAEVNSIRQRYIATYGEDFPKHFTYTGLALNRTDSGGWYPLDFGKSFKDDRIGEKLPVSIELSLLSIFFAYIIAIPLGIHSAVSRGSFADSAITTVLFVLYSLPSFWVALMLLLYFSEGGVGFKWFPVKGLFGDLGANPGWFAWFIDHLWHLALPVFCLTYSSFAYISRQMRAGMLEVIRQDYIRTARAKGLDERVVIFKHALRNSLIPIITIVAFILPALVGGSVIIETIFNIDGIGKLSFEAILTRDYPIIMAIFTLTAFLTLIGILLSDLAYAVVNPTISFEGK